MILFHYILKRHYFDIFNSNYLYMQTVICRLCRRKCEYVLFQQKTHYFTWQIIRNFNLRQILRIERSIDSSRQQWVTFYHVPCQPCLFTSIVTLGRRHFLSKWGVSMSAYLKCWVLPVSIVRKSILMSYSTTICIVVWINTIGNHIVVYYRISHYVCGHLHSWMNLCAVTVSSCYRSVDHNIKRQTFLRFWSICFRM